MENIPAVIAKISSLGDEYDSIVAENSKLEAELESMKQTRTMLEKIGEHHDALIESSSKSKVFTMKNDAAAHSVTQKSKEVASMWFLGDIRDAFVQTLNKCDTSQINFDKTAAAIIGLIEAELIGPMRRILERFARIIGCIRARHDSAEAIKAMLERRNVIEKRLVTALQFFYV